MEENPRYITDDKFNKLKESIKAFPEMLKIRPIVVDDDIKHFISVLNLSPVNITKPEMIDQIINNIAVCCMDAGLSLFGLSQFGDVRKYEHTQPFLLNSWTGTIVGIIGRKHRFTEINKLKVDADFSLINIV